MENGDTENPPEQFSKTRITHVHAGWPSANVKDVDQRYNQIRELIVNGAEVFADKFDDGDKRQCQLVGHGTTIGFANESCFQTPDTKSISHHVNAEVSSTVPFQMYGAGGSDTSGNEDSEYSAISSDFDSETYNSSAYKSARSNLDVHKMLENHFVDNVGGRYEGQLGGMAKLQKELSLSRKELELSEKEVSRLQKDVDELTVIFESQLDSARNELKEQETSFEMEKKKVVMLQNQVSILENQIVSSNTKTGSLEMELDIAKLKLERSEEEILNLKNSDDSPELKNQLELAHQQLAILNAKLDGEKRQDLEMQNRIQQYISDISNRDHLTRNLEIIMWRMADKHHEELVELRSHISSLADNLRLVEASSEEWENRCASLEGQLQQYEADMTEMRRLHEAQEIRWKNSIDLIETELNEKVGSVETLSKDLDTHKLKYNVLEAEKVDANCMIQALEAELGSKENQILQMDRLLQQLQLEKGELITVLDSSRKQNENVRLKLKDLENQVQSHKVLFLDRAEEKREAIRQLCFAMEYYRNRYEQLFHSCSGCK